MKAYGPSVFNVVMYPQAINGSYHFMNYLKMAKQCSTADHWEIIFGVFVWNSWWAHPENVMLCGMLSQFSTPKIKVRSRGKFLKARKTTRKSRAKKVRRFKHPKINQLNEESVDVLDLIDWTKFRNCEITDSPLLQDLIDEDCNEDLEKNIKEKIPGVFCILCHNQHCERCVCYTTKAVKKNIGLVNQKAAVIITEKNCHDYPTKMSKTDFKTKLHFDDE